MGVMGGGFEEFRTWMRNARGVYTPCPRCGGVGVVLYGNTSTWRKGVGGAKPSHDVCDQCWGTGDTSRQGVDLREQARRLKELEAERIYFLADREQLRQERNEARDLASELWREFCGNPVYQKRYPWLEEESDD